MLILEGGGYMFLCNIVPCDLEDLMSRRGIHGDEPETPRTSFSFLGEENSLWKRGRVCLLEYQ